MKQRTYVVLFVVMLTSGCVAMRHGRPIFGGSVVGNPTGTIAGHVRTIDGAPVDGRRVTAVGLLTKTRYDATTGNDGGYTLKVPEGRYRLEVELHDGDRVAVQPPDTHITLSDVDEARDFVITREPPAGSGR